METIMNIRNTLFAGALVCASVLGADNALALNLHEPVCGPGEAVFNMLVRRFGEAPGKMAINEPRDRAYVVFTNPESGTWTAVIFARDGGACIIAVGERNEVPPAPVFTLPSKRNA